MQALRELRAGRVLALVSDAGMPAVSDPGAALVSFAIALPEGGSGAEVASRRWTLASNVSKCIGWRQMPFFMPSA